jgi:hypothetical protein
MVMTFSPSMIVIKDSIIFTTVAGRRALVQADYTPLVGQPVTMPFAPDKAAIKQLELIHGAGSAPVFLQNLLYHRTFVQ